MLLPIACFVLETGCVEGYGNINMLTGVCAECAAGMYAMEGNAGGACIVCTDANATTLPGNRNLPADCVCKPGYTPGNSACEQCALDTIKPAAGDDVCTACGEGAHSGDNITCGRKSRCFELPYMPRDTRRLMAKRFRSL